MKIVGLTFILLCFGCISCSHAESQTPPAQQLIKQKFLCESSHTNFAWGFSHHGIYVDNQGNVYKFDYGTNAEPWPLVPVPPDSVTEQALEERYSHGRKLIGKIDSKDLLEKYRLIAPASKGQYSKHVQQGADQGGNAEICYLYDEATGRYTDIELREQGDWSYENLSPEAKQLAEWLKSLKASMYTIMP